MRIWSILAVSCSLLVVGCFKKNGANSTSQSADAVPGLNGTWDLSCQKSANGEFKSVKDTYDGENFTTFESSFLPTDETCSTPNITISGKAKVIVPKDEKSTGGGIPVDYKIISLTITPNTAAVVANLNEKKFCDASDWQLNVTKIFSETPCPNVPNFKKNNILKNIVRVSDDQKTLVYGVPSTETRPTAFTESEVYKKQ